ncbi:MAG: hypothetical protein ACLFQB_02935 [Chitinispirillaceae bacterium]
MRITARDFLSNALAEATTQLFTPEISDCQKHLTLYRTSKSCFGDLCSPAPLRLSSLTQKSSSCIATLISNTIHLDNQYTNPGIHHQNGFLNFFISRSYMFTVLNNLCYYSFMNSENTTDRTITNCISALKNAAVRGITLREKCVDEGSKINRDELELLRLVTLCHDDLCSADPARFKRNSVKKTLKMYESFYRKHPIFTNSPETTLLRLKLTNAVCIVSQKKGFLQPGTL